MKKFLKFTVVSLGILIVILLSITIITIFKKYKNSDIDISNRISLNLALEDDYQIKNFQIDKKQIHLYLENKKDNSQLIRTYDIKDGTLSSELIIK